MKIQICATMRMRFLSLNRTRGHLPLLFLVMLSVSLWRTNKGEDYIVALVGEQTNYIHASTGDTDGWFKLQSQPPISLGSYSKKYINLYIWFKATDGVGNKSVIVSTSDNSLNIYSQHGNMSFSPIPISALGTKYIVSSCQHPGSYISVLVIATHMLKANINITFKLEGSYLYGGKTYSDGDTLALSLDSNQTFTINTTYDLTGTVISTSETVAVFNGMYESSFLRAYDQLLPVTHYGQEYVVAVDDIAALYQMQIISEHKNTQITFNNRSIVRLGESRIYRGTLTRNESFVFTTNKPVMTTLCRRGSSYSGFVVVPHMFVSMKRSNVLMHQGDKAKILTVKCTTSIQVKTSPISSIPIDWQVIRGSRFQVGTFVADSYSSYHIGSNTDWFTVLVYRNYFIYNGGYNFSSDSRQTTISTCEDYIAAVFGRGIVETVSKEKWGWIQLQSESRKGFGSYSMYSLTADISTRSYSGIENKSIPITLSDDSIMLYMRNSNWYYTPLKVSNLGTKYVVSSCHPSDSGYTSVLVIATHNMMSSVNIDFRLEGTVTFNGRVYRNEETLLFNLDEYQRFIIKSKYDLTGTTISTSRSVAVFSGTVYRTTVSTYDQLLPVTHHGTEYAVAVDDYAHRYQLQIVSEHSDTEIMFNNGSSVSMENGRFYRQTLERNVSLSFTTTRPVMATLCRGTTYFSGFVVLPQMTSGRKRSNIYVHYRGCAKILTEKDTTDVQVRTSPKYSVPVHWEDVPGSRFQVGTWVVTGTSSYYISSDIGRFTVLVYQPYYVHNGGYNFSSDTLQTTVSIPASTMSTPREAISPDITDITKTMRTPPFNSSVDVGAALGSVILILVCIVTALLIYIRKLLAQKKIYDVSSSYHATPTGSGDVRVSTVANEYATFDRENSCEAIYDVAGESTDEPEIDYVNFEVFNHQF